MADYAVKDGEGYGFKDVLYTKAKGVATIVLNRAKAYNAYSTSTLKEITQAMVDASWDDSVAVIVYTGAGDRAFCTGGDVKEYEDKYTERPRDYWKYMGLFRKYLESIMQNGKPTIARINGIAVGGGNESQLACDMTVMAEHAYLGQVGTSVGSVACGGATQWLPIVVGDKRAREMLMTNCKIPAKKALEWGLVNRVSPTVKKGGKFVDNPAADEIKKAQNKEGGYEIDLSRLDADVAELAETLKEKFPECLRYTKQQVNYFKDQAWHMTVPHAQDWLSLHFACLEPHEGMTAFVEKRKSDYAGIRKKMAEGGSSEFVWGPYKKACPKCGAKGLPKGFQFCGNCGAKLS